MCRAGVFDDITGGIDMPKATRVSLSIPASSVSSDKSEGHPLVLIILFCGVGLLVSLVAILMGIQLVWY